MGGKNHVFEFRGIQKKLGLQKLNFDVILMLSIHLSIHVCLG